MSQKIDGKTIYVKIDKVLLARMEKVMKKTGKTQAQTIRNLCEVGCDVFSFYNVSGVFDIAKIIKKLKKKLKKDISPGLFDQS